MLPFIAEYLSSAHSNWCHADSALTTHTCLSPSEVSRQLTVCLHRCQMNSSKSDASLPATRSRPLGASLTRHYLTWRAPSPICEWFYFSGPSPEPLCIRSNHCKPSWVVSVVPRDEALTSGRTNDGQIALQPHSTTTHSLCIPCAHHALLSKYKDGGEKMIYIYGGVLLDASAKTARESTFVCFP